MEALLPLKFTVTVYTKEGNPYEQSEQEALHVYRLYRYCEGRYTVPS